MAKQQVTETTPEKGSIFKAVLVWGLSGLILVGTSIGGTLYLTGSMDKLGLGDAEAAYQSKVSPAPSTPPAHYLPLDPPFTVNFDDQGLLRYLQINVSVMARDKAVLESVQNHLPQIRYNLIVLFGSRDFATLSSTEGKEKLRALALKEIQAILTKEIGAPGIEAVYFTNFVMQ